jgi:hypothetical protein
MYKKTLRYIGQEFQRHNELVCKNYQAFTTIPSKAHLNPIP